MADHFYDEELLGDEQFDRLDELLSLFFDDALTQDEADELNTLLVADPLARRRSFEAAQLHADLYAHFNPRRNTAVAPALPVGTAGVGFSLMP